MEIILHENSQLGRVGDIVRVKDGFARNFLIPKGKAVRATAKAKAEFELKRAEYEKIAAEQIAIAQTRAAELEALHVTVLAHAGEEGKLFGSVGAVELALAITETGVEVQKSEIKLPEGPLRSIGDFDVTVQVHSEVSATVKVTVVAGDEA